ncbi:hypothetical protein ACU5AY_11120 [Rhizobium sp. PAMB 3174]
MKLGATKDVVIALSNGTDEDIELGVNTIQTYATVSTNVLDALLGHADPVAGDPVTHPLLRRSMTALEDLAALKVRNGIALFSDTVATMIALIDELEVHADDAGEAQEIRRKLTIAAEEAQAQFESIALLPFRSSTVPDLVQPSWPPAGSAWQPWWETFSALIFSEHLLEVDGLLAEARSVLESVLALD